MNIEDLSPEQLAAITSAAVEATLRQGGVISYDRVGSVVAFGIGMPEIQVCELKAPEPSADDLPEVDRNGVPYDES